MSAAGNLQVQLPRQNATHQGPKAEHKLKCVYRVKQTNIMEGRLGAELAAEARSLPTLFNDGHIDNETSKFERQMQASAKPTDRRDGPGPQRKQCPPPRPKLGIVLNPS